MGEAAKVRQSLRMRVHQALDPAERSKGLSRLNLALAGLILASVAVTLIETEPTILAGREMWFRIAEIGFAMIFAIEYAARFWTAADDAKLGLGWKARALWAVSPAAVIDLLAFAPTLLLAGEAGPAYLLRLVRLTRVLRIAKLGRFSTAWTLIAQVLTSRRHELLLTLVMAMIVVVTSASVLYLIEGPSDPERFGSIPRAMWWAVITLTTIGYGDVYPASVLGKVVASITAFLGIGLIAAPTGILAAAFSEAMRNRQVKADEAD